MKLAVDVTNFDYPGGPEALQNRMTTLATRAVARRNDYRLL
jgi:hypothetical protein